MKKISICTQIKNRLYQFKETFYKNLKVINQYENIEWNIVDVNSTDGLKKFVSSYVSSNINYFESIYNIEYSIPIAKNFAFRLSSGEYIFNLDADNFLGSVIDKIIEYKYIPIYCNKFRLGVYGRIGCDKEIIKETGGYDESFLPAGHHEQDFMARCNLIHHNFTHVDFDELPLQNTKEDTISNINTNISWGLMNEINTVKTNTNIVNKIVNPNKNYTQCDFIHNFNRITRLSESF
jgi:hypothetical protein